MSFEWRRDSLLPKSKVGFFASTGLLAFYLAIIVFASYHHEIWRDEGRALGIAMDSANTVELFKNLKNEGHPFIWHALLQAGHRLTGQAVVLKGISLLVAFLAVTLFVFCSPFRWWQKALFIFGFFPLYEYSVVCRNYGISLLALFGLCAVYPKRFERPMLFGGILFFLANTNAHSMIISAIFLGVFILEFPKFLKKGWIGAGLAFAGILLAAAQMLPETSNHFSSLHKLTTSSILKAAAASFIKPWSYFSSAFSFPSPWIAGGVLYGACFFLFRRPKLLGIWVAAIFSLSLFIILIYPAAIRHQGLLYLLLIALFWILKQESAQDSKIFSIFIGFLLISQVWMGVKAVSADVRGEYSCSRRAADFIRQNPSMNNAALIAEPDYLVESMNYYLPEHPIYLPREGKWGRKVSFTGQNKDRLGLKEVLDLAEAISEQAGRPTLLLTGHPLSLKAAPFEMADRWRKTFFCSRRQLLRMQSMTRRFRHFRGSITQEGYSVYFLDPKRKQ